METRQQEIKQLCSQFKLAGIAGGLDQVISQAEKETTGFMQFTLELLRTEAQHRLEKDEARRVKNSGVT